jgi:hypothetical protein
MAKWAEVLIDMLKLTEETKRMNAAIDKLEGRVLDLDRRLVRIETMAEMSMGSARKRIDEGGGR